MQDIDRYIRRETAFSVIGCTVVNILFFFLVFGSSGPIQIWGLGVYAFDFLPQSFMTALLCTLLPGVITRKRRAKGEVGNIVGSQPRPESLLARGLLYGLIALVLGAGGVALFLYLTGWDLVSWFPGFIFKLTYGAIIAVIVTPIGLRALLRETRR